MKTKAELEEIRLEINSLGKKLNELTEDELKEVTGGECPGFDAPTNHSGFKWGLWNNGDPIWIIGGDGN